MPFAKKTYTAQEVANIVMMDLPIDNTFDTDEELEIEEGDVSFQVENTEYSWDRKEF